MQTERWYKRESNSCFYCNASGFGLHGHRQDSHPRTKRGRNCHKEEQRLHCFPYKSLPMNRELFRFHPIDKRADKCPQVTADWVWSIWRAIFATGGIRSPYDTNSAAYARITPDRVCDATSAIGLQAFESIVGFCCTTFKKQRCNIFSSFFAYPLSLIWVSWAWRFLDIVNRPQLIRYLLATESVHRTDGDACADAPWSAHVCAAAKERQSLSAIPVPAVCLWMEEIRYKSCLLSSLACWYGIIRCCKK